MFVLDHKQRATWAKSEQKSIFPQEKCTKNPPQTLPLSSGVNSGHDAVSQLFYRMTSCAEDTLSSLATGPRFVETWGMTAWGGYVTREKRVRLCGAKTQQGLVAWCKPCSPGWKSHPLIKGWGVGCSLLWLIPATISCTSWCSLLWKCNEPFLPF